VIPYIVKRQQVEKSGDGSIRNFTETLYVDDQFGTGYPMFTLTQAGYRLRVGDMTGKEVVEACE
jgi:phage regulator Rha-like protein